MLLLHRCQEEQEELPPFHPLSLLKYRSRNERVSESVCFQSIGCLISNFKKKKWLEGTKFGVLVCYLKVLIQPRNRCGLRGICSVCSGFCHLFFFFFPSWGPLGKRRQVSGVSSSFRGLSEPKVGELKSELMRLSEWVCTWECLYVHSFIHAYIYIHTHTCIYIYTHTYIHTCIYIYVYKMKRPRTEGFYSTSLE